MNFKLLTYKFTPLLKAHVNQITKNYNWKHIRLTSSWWHDILKFSCQFKIKGQHVNLILKSSVSYGRGTSEAGGERLWQDECCRVQRWGFPHKRAQIINAGCHHWHHNNPQLSAGSQHAYRVNQGENNTKVGPIELVFSLGRWILRSILTTSDWTCHHQHSACPRKKGSAIRTMHD